MAKRVGTSGNDRLKGTTGKDTFIGLDGRDVFRGNGGRDVVDYSQDMLHGATKGVKVNLWGSGSQGGLTADSAIDSFGFKDKLVSIRDAIGTQFADKIYGGSHANTLWGGAGRDLLNGFRDKDKLIGGWGADKLYGGEGADAFIFVDVADSTVAKGGRDTIFDFSHDEGDRINLSKIDAREGPRNHPFKFIGDDAFHKKAGELRYQKKGGTTLVQGDTDGDGKADFAIALKGAFDLVKGDFAL
jgi:serralysin